MPFCPFLGKSSPSRLGGPAQIATEVPAKPVLRGGRYLERVSYKAYKPPIARAR